MFAKTGYFLTVPAALAMLSAIAAIADPASRQQAPLEATSVTCTGLKTIEVVNYAGMIETHSDTYVDVPFAIARFITKKPGCVLVTFSAPVKSDGNYVSVQIVMNSSTCLPSTETPNIFAVSDRFDVYANSMTYICPDVPISKKVLKAQWKFAHTGGDSAYLYGFTMTVAHR